MPIRPENRDRYPADWAQIRARILDREGHRCKWCRVANYAVGRRNKHGGFIPAGGNVVLDALGDGRAYPEDRPSTCREAREAADEMNLSAIGRPWVVIVLTIAHLDHIPEHNDPANLAALCQQCHNRYDIASRRAGIRERANAGQPSLLAETGSEMWAQSTEERS